MKGSHARRFLVALTGCGLGVAGHFALRAWPSAPLGDAIGTAEIPSTTELSRIVEETLGQPVDAWPSAFRRVEARKPNYLPALAYCCSRADAWGAMGATASLPHEPRRISKLLILGEVDEREFVQLAGECDPISETEEFLADLCSLVYQRIRDPVVQRRILATLIREALAEGNLSKVGVLWERASERYPEEMTRQVIGLASPAEIEALVVQSERLGAEQKTIIWRHSSGELMSPEGEIGLVAARILGLLNPSEGMEQIVKMKVSERSRSELLEALLCAVEEPDEAAAIWDTSDMWQRYPAITDKLIPKWTASSRGSNLLWLKGRSGGFIDAVMPAVARAVAAEQPDNPSHIVMLLSEAMGREVAVHEQRAVAEALILEQPDLAWISYLETLPTEDKRRHAHEFHDFVLKLSKTSPETARGAYRDIAEIDKIYEAGGKRIGTAEAMAMASQIDGISRLVARYAIGEQPEEVDEYLGGLASNKARSRLALNIAKEHGPRSLESTVAATRHLGVYGDSAAELIARSVTETGASWERLESLDVPPDVLADVHALLESTRYPAPTWYDYSSMTSTR